MHVAQSDFGFWENGMHENKDSKVRRMSLCRRDAL